MTDDCFVATCDVCAWRSVPVMDTTAKKLSVCHVLDAHPEL